MTTLHPTPSLPHPGDLRLSLCAFLSRLLTPDAARTHGRTQLARTLEAEAHHARVQRTLLGVRP